MNAVRQVLENHFATNTAPGSCSLEIHDKSRWRREHLYSHDVDEVLSGQLAALKAVFTCFQGKYLSVKKLDQLPLKNFLMLLKHLSFFDMDFTIREAKLCFQLSKMCKVDEVKSVREAGRYHFFATLYCARWMFSHCPVLFSS